MHGPSSLEGSNRTESDEGPARILTWAPLLLRGIWDRHDRQLSAPRMVSTLPQVPTVLGIAVAGCPDLKMISSGMNPIPMTTGSRPSSDWMAILHSASLSLCQPKLGHKHAHALPKYLQH